MANIYKQVINEHKIKDSGYFYEEAGKGYKPSSIFMF